MSTTLPDVTIQPTTYTDIYAATGITVGTSVIIQNKGNHSAFLQTTGSAPSDSSMDGVLISPLEIFIVDAGESGLFARASFGNGRLSIQPA